MAAKSDEEVELLEKIESDGSELSEMAQEASVVRLVNEILLEAIQSRASDIHIESQSKGLIIRYLMTFFIFANSAGNQSISSSDYQSSKNYGSTEYCWQCLKMVESS